MCSTSNDPTSRFCKQCGTALAQAPAPAPVEDDSDDLARYVPEQLLRRIRTAKAGGAMRGERRTVTMLFADIQGSTAAAERMDPEDWADIINGAFEHLIAPIYRYEGTLARLQGDAILAFFGAPLAHEDDPDRAVRAGLDIVAAMHDYSRTVQARYGLEVAVRVGINTGLVVVGEVGSDLRVEYTALGDAINVAARMEQTAAPGSVRVTAITAGLLQDAFDLEDIGGVEVKGKAEPVAAYQVHGASVRPAEVEQTSPLVGRDAERQTLVAAVERLTDGVGGICSVVGEAGVGKSRLLGLLRAELANRATVGVAVTDVDADVAWLEAASRSFETGVPYASFARLLSRWWDIGDDGPSAWERLSDAVAGVMGEEEGDTAAFLATVVGVTLPAEQAEIVASLETPLLHRRTTEAVTRYLEAEAARRPVVLVLDDLHWGDALTLALVERLMGLVDSAALCVVLAMRPYREDASWGLLEVAARSYGHRASTVQLDALPVEATRALLASMLPDAAIDDETAARILERADGNPLFVEELARAVTTHIGGDGPAGGIGSRIEVPTSLTGLLTARLDQLDDDARVLAQVASIVGGEFDEEILAVLWDGGGSLGPAIAALVRNGIVVEHRRRPTSVYGFRHALLQDAAYETTLLRTRRDLHRRLAAHFETARPDAVQDIARHYVSAGAHDEAFPFLVQAGEHAARSMALADAIRLFTTALDAVPADADPGLVIRAHDGLGEAYGLVPDLPHVSSTYQRLIDYGHRAAHPKAAVTALNRLGIVTATHLGDFVKAESYLLEARQLAEEHNDQEGLAEYHMNACFVSVMQGELNAAIEHDGATEQLGVSQGSEQIRFGGLMRRALNLLNTLQFDEGAQALQEAIDVAEELGATDSLAALRAMGNSDLALRQGDFVQARRDLEEGVAVLDRFGSFYTGVALARASVVALRLGDLEGALASAAKAKRIAESYQQPFTGNVAAAVMSRAYAETQSDEHQDDLRAEALALLARPMGDMAASTTWLLLGQAALLRGDRTQAAADYAIGLEVSASTSFWDRPGLLVAAAEAAIAEGALERARGLIDEAAVYVERFGLATCDADIALVAGRLALAEDRWADADEHLQRAEDVARRQQLRLVERDAVQARVQLALALGDERSASAQREKAERLAADLAALIADEQLRASFLAHAALGAGATPEP